MKSRIFQSLALWLASAFFVSRAAAQTAPVIILQPQSQTVVAGSNATFTVEVAGSGQLPSVSSGNLRLWLKADAGVVTNAAGQVSQWQDQSGNGIDAYQSALNQQPILTNTVVPAGPAPAVRFNGIQDPIEGDYLQGTNDVGLSGNYTSFAVYSLFSSDSTEKSMVGIGQPGQTDQIRGYYINDDAMAFSAWANDYTSPFQIPIFTYRIWTDRLSMTNSPEEWLIELFDNDGTNSTYYSDVLSGLETPSPGLNVGGLGSDTRNFPGDLCEILFSIPGTLPIPTVWRCRLIYSPNTFLA